MTLTETLDKLDSLQAQIIHGPTIFADMAAAIREGQTWRPIDTAPRDGNVFLTFVPHSQVGFSFTACWNTAGRLLCMMSGDDYTAEATHWMPLPEFPEY